MPDRFLFVHGFRFSDFSQLATVEGYLAQTVLVVNPNKNGHFVLNFDPRILSMFQVLSIEDKHNCWIDWSKLGLGRVMIKQQLSSLQRVNDLAIMSF